MCRTAGCRALLRKQGPALGTAFLDCIEAAIGRLEAAPKRWPLLADGDIRRRPVRRFPFVLYYRLDDAGDLQILAIKHQRRNQGYWQHRG